MPGLDLFLHKLYLLYFRSSNSAVNLLDQNKFVVPLLVDHKYKDEHLRLEGILKHKEPLILCKK